MYTVLDDGQLSLVANCPSATSKETNAHEDGPRHNIPSPDGSKLYAVTEHSKLRVELAWGPLPPHARC